MPQKESDAQGQRTLNHQSPIAPLRWCVRSSHVHDDDPGISALTRLEHVKDEVHDFEHTCQLWSQNYRITKIAQGGFAAIFRLQLRADTSKYVIAKLMPLKPKTGKGSRIASHTTIQDAATEVKALDAMSEIPGFVGFSEAWVLKGSLPSLFKKEYRNWARTHPEDDSMNYSKDQLWCFIEMSDAGTDLEQFLEHGTLNRDSPRMSTMVQHLTIFQCWDIFWGTAEALGRGEEFSEFEHRDLHPGNVCIKEAKPIESQSSESFLRKKYTNLEVTLIDYTLSRATLTNGEVLAHPVTDKSIFEQRVENPCTQQEQDDDQQYDMYRMMRELVILDSLGCKDEAKKWQDFVPQTNILWLYHILSILLKRLGTHNTARKKENRTKIEARQKDLAKRIATTQPDVAEEGQLRQWLQGLVEGLNPKQKHGPRWSSATALLECEQYWMDDA